MNSKVFFLFGCILFATIACTNANVTILGLSSSSYFTDQNNSTNGFGGGKTSGLAWDTKNNFLRLDQSVFATNNSELDSTWTPQWNNIIGYWKLNETLPGTVNGGAADFADSGPLGTNYGSVAGAASGINLGQTGKLNKSVSFTGPSTTCTGTYINLRSPGTFKPLDGLSKFTMAAWINPNYPTYFPADIIGQELRGKFSIYRVNSSGNLDISISINSIDGSSYQSAQLVSVVPNIWTHVAITYDSSATPTLQVFLNGIPQVYSLLAGAILPSGSIYTTNADLSSTGEGFTFLIGGANNNNYVGLIDDVAIWNSALTSQQVQTIFNRQSAQHASTFISRVFDGNVFSTTYNWFSLNPITTLPFLKELPDSSSSSLQTSESASSYSSLTPNLMNGLIGLWHLDEPSGTSATNSVIDSSGKGHYGTPSNVSFGSFGKLGTSAGFDGSSSSIKLLDSQNDFQFATTLSFTLSAWINFSNLPSQNYLILTNGASGWSAGFALMANDGGYGGTQGGIFFYMGDVNTSPSSSNAVGVASSGLALNDSHWHLVTVSVDQSAKKIVLYIDGQVSNIVIPRGPTSTCGTLSGSTLSYAGCNSYTASNGNTFIGNGPISPWPGYIDEVAIWNRALNSQEVLQIYRRAANRIKYQVHTCTFSDCSDNSAWFGPDNTNQTYFSELNNNIVPLTGADINTTDYVLNSLPIFNFANFGGFIPRTRYFQYRAILESDDTSTNCNYGSGGTWCSPEIQKITVVPSN